MELDELKDCSYKPSKMITGKYTLELSNHEVQDILEDMDMIDDNGICRYTTEEIFKAGVEYAFNVSLNWLKDNMDLEHDYPSSNEELINNFNKLYYGEI